jgi:hypothetical protein
MPIEWPWKRWARERRESEESLKWLNGQQRALEAGEEIEPPYRCPSDSGADQKTNDKAIV